MTNDKLTRAEKARHYRIKKILDNYEFERDVKDSTEFKNFLDKEVKILHKHCGRTYKVILKDFYKSTSGILNYLYDYVEDKSYLHCPHCLQETKNKYFQDILDKKSNFNYELVGDYKMAHEKITIRHKVCGETMQIFGANILSLKSQLKCKHCVKILKNHESIC